MQEMLWQVGDLPGAVVPVDHEVFLEFDARPQQQPPPPTAPAPAAQAPPDTEIYLAPLKIVERRTRGRRRRSTSPTVPATTTSRSSRRTAGACCSRRRGPRGADAAARRQTDIYRYDIAPRSRSSQVTSTPESEYSPTVTPDGQPLGRSASSSTRTRRSGSGSSPPTDANPQRGAGERQAGRLPRVGRRPDARAVRLGAAASPRRCSSPTRAPAPRATLATDIGRSIQRIPGRRQPTRRTSASSSASGTGDDASVS